MQEGIGHKLPDPAVQHRQRRHQTEMNIRPASALGEVNAATTATSRNTAPLAISSCFTAGVNGGKLRDIVVPRRIWKTPF